MLHRQQRDGVAGQVFGCRNFCGSCQSSTCCRAVAPETKAKAGRFAVGFWLGRFHNFVTGVVWLLAGSASREGRCPLGSLKAGHRDASPKRWRWLHPLPANHRPSRMGTALRSFELTRKIRLQPVCRSFSTRAQTNRRQRNLNRGKSGGSGSVPARDSPARPTKRPVAG